METNFILASGSPRRHELLAQAGYRFTVHPSDYKEDLTLKLSPVELALHLAEGKTHTIAAQHPDAVVLGADTLVVLGQEILGKPKDHDHARTMLQQLSGSTHKVITAFSLLHLKTDQVYSEAVATEITFHPLTAEQIENYLHTDSPLDKAGAYGIQDKHDEFVADIQGDYHNVVGLPLEAVQKALTAFGIIPKS